MSNNPNCDEITAPFINLSVVMSITAPIREDKEKTQSLCSTSRPQNYKHKQTNANFIRVKNILLDTMKTDHYQQFCSDES